MTLIVEDGSGISNAESYGSVADATTYHASYGHAAWADGSVDDTDREIALRNATQYIDAVFGPRFLGYKVTDTQALEFPRFNLYDRAGRIIPHDIIPTKVKQATFELALSALTEPLLEDVETPGSVDFYSVQVGPIKEATSYSGGRSETTKRTLVEKLLQEFVKPGGVVTIGQQ